MNVITRKPIRLTTRPSTAELSIAWSVHNFCNFRCSYCPPYNSSASETWLKKENVFKFIDALREHYMEKLGFKNVRFSLTGGEPTIWRDLAETCERITASGMSIGLTSNGSTPLAHWDKFAANLQWLCLSFHPEQVKEEHFFSVLQHFHENPAYPLPAVRFMMHSDPVLWEKCLNFGQRIKDSFENWSMEFVKIENDFGKDITPVYYTPEQEAFLRVQRYEEQKGKPELIPPHGHWKEMDVTYTDGQTERLRANDLINAGQVDFLGWNCHAGLESLMIHPTGRITRAGCDVGGDIGYLHQAEPFTFPLSAVACDRDRCWCATDVFIAKFAPGQPDLVSHHE